MYHTCLQTTPFLEFHDVVTSGLCYATSIVSSKNENAFHLHVVLDVVIPFIFQLTNLFDTLFMLIVLLTELQPFFSDKADIENTWHSGVIRSYAPCTEVIFYGIQPSVLQSS